MPKGGFLTKIIHGLKKYICNDDSAAPFFRNCDCCCSAGGGGRVAPNDATEGENELKVEDGEEKDGSQVEQHKGQPIHQTVISL